ncbi:MAG: DUF2958 domain-containing protein [Candidatus Brocadiia bacterium]
MKLLTKKLREKLPDLYSQEDMGGEAVAYVKFFTPDSDWTWYVTEGSPVATGDDRHDISFAEAEEQGLETRDVLFFGLVDGFAKELGYFRLSELREARGPLGLPIERDIDWGPKTLEDIAPELFTEPQPEAQQ